MALPQFRPLSLAIVGGVVGAMIGFVLGGYLGRLFLGSFLEVSPPANEMEAMQDFSGRLNAVATFWGGVIGIILCGVLAAIGGVVMGWSLAAQIPVEPLPPDDPPNSNDDPDSNLPPPGV